MNEKHKYQQKVRKKKEVMKKGERKTKAKEK